MLSAVQSKNYGDNQDIRLALTIGVAGLQAPEHTLANLKTV